ncbi:MAG TPA: sigma-70 family RNA polymerase sigma factor [Gemmatimonadales bacterium]
MTVDWAHVYRTTFEDLVRFLYRKVWDADRAHDLAQEAFVRGLNETPDHPRAWLFTVAGNLARDEARAAERRKRHLVLIKTEAELRPVPNPAEELDRSEQVRAVRRALESLTERDRDVLLLWDAGLNYEEIAAETGLAGSAIGTTLARARKRLVAAYEAQEERHAAHQ